MSPAEELLALLQEARWRPADGECEPCVTGALTLDERGVLGGVSAPWVLLAQGLSLEAGGLWMAGEESLTWVRGRRIAQLVDVSRYDTLQLGRGALLAMGVPVTSWTTSGLATQGLSWIGARSIPRAGTVERLSRPGWAYHCWRPGCYADAGLYDLEAAYYAALLRLPSPAVDWLEEGPIWHPLAVESKARWRSLLVACGAVKALRLCLVGCMVGSGKGCVTFHRGKRLPPRRSCGPFKAGALAVIRAVYELTALASIEEEALWAHTDAVILPGTRTPRVWERYGYRYRHEAQGAAEVCHATVYKVGSKQTALYQAGSRFPLPAYQPSVPSPLTLAAWH